MATAMQPCSVGQHMKSSDCHKTAYTRKCGLIPINSLEKELVELLFLRAGINAGTNIEGQTICYHHQQILLEKYEFLQKNCCDPFSAHKKTVSGSLRVIDMATSQFLTRKTGQHVIPGQKYCPSCRKQTNSLALESCESDRCESDMDDDTSPDYNPPSDPKLNWTFTELGISPIKVSRVGERDKVSYGKRKLEQANSALRNELGQTLNVEPLVLSPTEEAENLCQECEDMHILIDVQKEKCKVSNRQKKIQILTLVPDSWSIEKTSCEFNVSRYLVRQARALKKSDGILAEPQPKVGHGLSAQDIEQVKAFYEHDEYSRMCPGQNDFVSVRINGEKQHKQKRLLLCNLNELHAHFKEKTNIKIGISKFCELRPKWCVTVGPRGTHSVCVCEIHQNVKLMLASTALRKHKLDYHDLMKLLVCSITSEECMIHRCPQCPEKQVLLDHLTSIITDDFDEGDLISFQQWLHTDSTTLVMQQLPVTEFLTALVDRLDSLTVHHYVSKAQSAFLTQSKENLAEDQAVALLDFAENYSFLVQDAVQGFHWDNSQSTLHPFAIYYKDAGELWKSSICVVSDCMKHDTVAVHLFQKVVLDHLKQVKPTICTIKYFSDGAASQYKNFKNFANLCHHKDDFGLKAEWHFFATSHGKSACDGIGGTVKRLATRASLQRPTDKQILTSQSLYDFCVQGIKGIKFFFVSQEEVENHRQFLQQRFANAKKVPGTRDFHCFIPAQDASLQTSRVSASSHKLQDAHVETYKMGDFKPGQYVACMYDHVWWIGIVVETDHEHEDVKVNFMHPHGPAALFAWPRRQDLCWVPSYNILGKITPPEATMLGRRYSLDSASAKFIEGKFK